MSGGDRNKDLRQAKKLWEWLIKNGVKRDSILISFGGGVVGDLSGFVASTILRGIRHYHVPTTLLAMVDSSIGGKTGINLGRMKNAVGTFWSADKIFIDPLFLLSIDKKNLFSGLVEAIKAAIIGDAGLLDFIERNLNLIKLFDFEVIEKVILRAIRVKKQIVEEDPFEAESRRKLNLGHTLAHAVEAYHHYKIPHGEAVGLGLLYAAKISESYDNDLRTSGFGERMKQLLRQLGLRTKIKAEKKKLFAYMMMDKKNTSGGLNFVLVKKPGLAFISKDVPKKLMLKAMEEVVDEDISD
jgi:3-dehydroquinate synthase